MSTKNETRHDRAEQITIEERRRISDEIWEVDVTNENGESRENLTLVPSEVYSPTKDMQHRGPKGVVGKYLRALAMEDADAKIQLLTALSERRGEVEDDIDFLRQKKNRIEQAEKELRNS